MTRGAVRLLFLVLFLDLLFGTLLIHVGTAQGIPSIEAGSWANEPTPPSINIQSPIEKINYWVESDVWLNFTVTVPLSVWRPSPGATILGDLTQVSYSIDGKAENNLELPEHQEVQSFQVNLERLSAGQHTVTVSVDGYGYYGNLTKTVSIVHYTFEEAGAKIAYVNSSESVNFVVDEVRPSTPQPTATPTPESSATSPIGVILYTSAFAATTVVAVTALALKKWRSKSGDKL